MTIVDRAARFLERRTDRRGFLRRGALAGSAMTVAPAAYVLRPTTAYAAICNCSGQSCDCGATCCDGYTEFCCTTTGVNGCPPGTSYGGWWKADGSGYCDNGSPQPRYYLDCNASCGSCGCGSGGICSGSCSGTRCGCAAGSCGNRKAGCTGFRYGQCNQGIACLGPIVCRVVTCTPPWLLDPTCTTAVRTDNNTRFHNRPCLQIDPGNPEGNVVDVQLAPDGVRVVGYVVPQAPTNIAITVGAEGIGYTEATLTEPPPGFDAVNGGVRWFDVSVPLGPGTHTVCANVVEGLSLRTIGCRRLTVPGGNPFGELEMATTSPFGTIDVVGWAIDPNTDNFVRVEIHVDDEFVAFARADLARPDLTDYGAFGPDHGFAASVEAGPGARRVCVYAVNRGVGQRTLIGCADVVVPDGSPFGAARIEAVAGGVYLRGWVIDPDIEQASMVDVLIDGEVALSRRANLPRPDVAQAFPEAGPDHGFDIVVEGVTGSHQVCLRARNGGSGRRTTIDCADVSVPTGSPLGAVESLTVGPDEVRVRGWVADPDTPKAVNLHVYLDDVFWGGVRADGDRPDVPGYGSGGGFDFVVPVDAGTHELRVHARDRQSPGRTVLLDRSRFTTPTGSPFGRLQKVEPGSGQVTVRGWVIDPDTDGPAGVHVYVDGVFAGAGRADRHKGRVAAVNPGYSSRHGFKITVPAGSGTREVCVYGKDKVGGQPNTLLGCRTVEVS
ncbi:MAG: hypothetical protein ACR2QE_06320 [Acidimicrobiales bacterium]